MGDSVWLGDSGAGNDSGGRGVVDDHKVVDLLVLNYSATAIFGIDGGKYFNQSKALRSWRMTQLLLIYAHGLQEVYLEQLLHVPGF